MISTDGEGTLDNDKIAKLKTNINELANVVRVIKGKIPKPQDIVPYVKEIKELITDLFFKQDEEALLDNLIKSFFTHFTHGYLQKFLSFVENGGTAITLGESKISQNNVGIIFCGSFSGEEFKNFVSESIEKDLTLAPPEKTTKIVLSLRSNLNKPPLDTEPKITLLSNAYSVLSTYLATFFPLSQ